MYSTLNTTTQYQNHAVCERYKKTYPNHSLSAELALKEVVKYLWLTQKHQHDQKEYPQDQSLQFICSMYPEMHEIDDMWHTFLLFTQDYMHFCTHYFGHYIHHTPKTEKDIIAPDRFETEFTRYLSYVYNQLGEETLKRWFAVCLD